MLQFPPSDSHEHTQERGSEGAGPHEGGRSAAPQAPEYAEPTIQSPTEASAGHMWGDQIEMFPQRQTEDCPDGDQSIQGEPSVGSVDLRGQGDQRDYAEQSRLKVPGDMRVVEGGQKSNPAEAMPGAE